jgi:hypothetical protein
MPGNDRAQLDDEQGRTTQCRDKRQTRPVEHKGIPTVDESVLATSLLGDPEGAAKAFHLTAGAVRDAERFALLR